LTPRFRAFPGLERVGITLSGRNADVERLPWLPSQPQRLVTDASSSVSPVY
jgi:hypothetical protein